MNIQRFGFPLGRVAVVVFATLAFGHLYSRAQLIVDTGPGQMIGGGVGLAAAPSSASCGYQWLAAKFYLPQVSCIASVQGWIGIYSAGEGGISINTDTSGSPCEALFSDRYFAAPSPSPTWLGVQGKQWTLAQGWYWAVFGPLPPDDVATAFAGSMPMGTPNPLPAYAMKVVEADWQQWMDPHGSLGVRIFGAPVPTAVPEPSAWTVMGAIVMASLCALRRHRNAEQ